MILERSSPRARRILRRVILAAAMAGGSYAAWAAREVPTDTVYDVALKLNIDGAIATPRLLTRAGEQASIAIGEGAQKWQAAFLLKPVKSGAVLVSTNWAHGGRQIGKPSMLVALGEPATVKLAGDDNSTMAMRLTVNEVRSPK